MAKIRRIRQTFSSSKFANIRYIDKLMDVYVFNASTPQIKGMPEPIYHI